MFSLYSAILILTLSLISVNSVSVTKSNATHITEALVDSLGPSAWTNRPVLDPNTVTNVTLSFVLTQIIELNGVHQELKVAGWFTMEWHDEFIRWNASEYGVNCVGIPQDRIWKPDLTLDNNIDEEYNQFLPNTPVQICSDGSATYSAYSIFRSSCNISIRVFPYDNQTCTLRFSSWVHDAFELDVHPDLRVLDQDVDLFNDYGVWQYLSVDARREVKKYKSGDNPYVYTVFSFHLQRRHKFQLLFILIPYFFCSFLICLMFFIPNKSGEKLSYGITAVLGMIVFQDVISSSLPPVGNESALVGKYFASVIGIGITSVFLEIIVTNIHMQGNVYKFLHFCYRIKTGKTEQTEGNPSHSKTTQPQQQHEPELDEHTKKVQDYCATFELVLGVLCFLAFIILIIWFTTVT